MLLQCLVVCIAALYALHRWRQRHAYALERELYAGLPSLPFLGHAYLFFGDNEMSIWKRRRRVLAPTFASKNMRHFLSIFNKQSDVLVRRLARVAGEAGDCHPGAPLWGYYTAYTMDSIAEATLGYEMHAQAGTEHPFLRAFDAGLQHAAKRLCSPWLHTDVVFHNLPVYKKLEEMRNYMWTFLSKLIDLKRKEICEKDGDEDANNDNATSTGPSTFLESLIRSSGGEHGYTDVEVFEELIVIMMAGNDTTAVASSFVSLMLATHPEVQDKVFTELQEVFEASDRPMTTEDLPRLKYLDAVIKETLRLYAPVPIITRKIENDIILPSGVKLVRGTGAVVNIWAVGRNPRHWGPDAEQFRPERFLEGRLAAPAAFLAFSHGARNCVGYQFALTSLKAALSRVLRRYRLRAEPRPLRLKFDLMMKDVDGFQVRLEYRHSI